MAPPRKGHKKKEELTLRYHFRSIGIIIWMLVSFMKVITDGKYTDHRKRSAGMVIRRKGKKSVLAATDKEIMRKQPQDRTPVEKRQLVILLSSLKCFARYPPTVRSRLASVTYFMQFPAGKVLVKEGHLASAMYFILDGEIIVSHLEYDAVTEKYVDRAIGMMGAGDMFGEVALLDRIARTASCISVTHVELLCIFAKDFDKILRSTLKFQWNQVHHAAGLFKYFQNWNKVQLRELCILGKIKQFAANQIIYSEDRGLLNFVYFVISGKCTVFQKLKMKSKTVGIKKTYELIKTGDKRTASQTFLAQINEAAEELYMKKMNQPIAGSSNIHTRTSLTTPKLDDELQNPPDSDITIEFMHRKPQLATLIMRDTQQADTTPLQDDPDTVYKCMEVGSYCSGGVFGLGERMEQKAVVAKTVVQCLVIPRYWLNQPEQNVGNIWPRTKAYLDTIFPTRDELFQYYMSTFKAEAYRKKLMDSLPKLASNPTNIHDVPIVCRVMDGRRNPCPF